MIRLEHSSPDTPLPLGQLLDVAWEAADPRIEARFFLEHEGLRYLRPLREWSTERRILIFPESPGAYVLRGEWCRPEGGDGGIVEAAFEVSAGRSFEGVPSRADLADKQVFWAPSAWEANMMSGAEHAALAEVDRLLEPGATA